MIESVLTIDADTDTDGPFGARYFTILIDVAEAREVLGAALGPDNLADEAAQDAKLAPIQVAVAVLVQLIEFPVDDAPLCSFRQRIYLNLSWPITRR